MDSVPARLAAIERKQDQLLHMLRTLIKAMAEDEETEPERSLDGREVGGERDATQGLG